MWSLTALSESRLVTREVILVNHAALEVDHARLPEEMAKCVVYIKDTR